MNKNNERKVKFLWTIIGDEKQNTKNIALGAALGGAGVIAASAGVSFFNYLFICLFFLLPSHIYNIHDTCKAFYLIRRHQINELKKKKALKLKAMGPDATPAS